MSSEELKKLLEDIHEYLNDSLQYDRDCLESTAKVNLIERIEEVI
jgi:hypothetical protein